MAKSAFWECKEFMKRDIGMKLNTKLLKCYIWPVALYGCETWPFTKDIERRLNALDIWCYRRIFKTGWTEKIKNDEIWRRASTNYSLLNAAKEQKLKFAGHVLIY